MAKNLNYFKQIEKALKDKYSYFKGLSKCKETTILLSFFYILVIILQIYLILILNVLIIINYSNFIILIFLLLLIVLLIDYFVIKQIQFLQKLIKIIFYLKDI